LHKNFPDHLMGFVEEAKPRARSNSSNFITAKAAVESEEVFLELKPEEKKLFILLRNFYNDLEGNVEDAVDVDLLLDALEANRTVREVFFIEDMKELEDETEKMPLTKEGLISWEEFLELIFNRRTKSKDNKEIKYKVPVVENDAEKMVGRWKRVKFKERKSKKKTGKKEDNPVLSKRTEMKITVPQPFKFDKREAVRKTKNTIRQQWLKNHLEEKKQEEDELVNTRFKANPIPLTTTMPLFEQMMEERQRRSEEVKQKSREITKARENPFTFYERDKNFYLEREEARKNNIPEPLRDIKPFKANPIPQAVKVAMMSKMHEEEEEIRAQRKKQWAYELAQQSHLPPRMEMHAREKANEPPKEPPRLTFEPFVAKAVPDFKKQQDAFQRALERHKASHVTTIPKPFNFQEAKKRASIHDFMDQGIPQVDVMPKKKQGKITSLKKPSINPPTTIKTKSMMELRRRQLEQRKQKEQQKLFEEKERKNKGNEVIFIR